MSKPRQKALYRGSRSYKPDPTCNLSGKTKIRYRSEAKARQALRHRSAATGYYECACGGWHLTSQVQRS